MCCVQQYGNKEKDSSVTDDQETGRVFALGNPNQLRLYIHQHQRICIRPRKRQHIQKVICAFRTFSTTTPGISTTTAKVHVLLRKLDHASHRRYVNYILPKFPKDIQWQCGKVHHGDLPANLAEANQKRRHHLLKQLTHPENHWSS